MSLEKYSGIWDQRMATHLMRRTTYGPDFNGITQVVELGMEEAVDQLIKDIDLPAPPVNYYFTNDPDVSIGETWIDAPYYRINGLNAYRNRSIYKWMVELAREKNISVREKMVLFWHNHFVTGSVGDPRFKYQYINTIRKQALGNFKQLTKDITIDGAMLRYLNGNQNREGNPNENYARELLELFTLGKGANVGDGDYTTFTEVDVRELARALTGWVIFGYNSERRPDFGSQYVANRHDTTDKKLSHRFNEITISNQGANEYAHVVDIIFTRRESAEFLCRKLYNWFVHSKIDNVIEAEVVQPMADLLINNNYELKPVLKALFQSEAFYDTKVIGCQIKHPLDFVLSVSNPFPIVEEETRRVVDDFDLGLYQATSALQMTIFDPPSVAGWKAFYQAPSFDQIWINSNTLPIRKLVVDYLTIVNRQLSNSPIAKLNVIEIIENTSDPLDINVLIPEISSILFAYPLPEKTILELKEILIPGLPDFEWTLEYLKLRNNPDDEDLKRIVSTKLLFMFNYLMNLPEFQLI